MKRQCTLYLSHVVGTIKYYPFLFYLELHVQQKLLKLDRD